MNNPMLSAISSPSVDMLAGGSGSVASGSSVLNPAGIAAVGSLHPPGAAILRLIQMYDAMAGKGSVNESHILNLNYWKNLVQEFFMPDGFFRQVAWNPSAREQRAFELPVSVLARYFHTVHLSGAVSTGVSLSHPREWPSSSLRSIPPPPLTKRPILGQPNARTTHFVQVDRVKMSVEYDNGWIVVHSGLLRAALTPFAGQLKFQFVDFLVTDHESYVPKKKMRRGIADQPLSDDLVAAIRGGAKSSGGADVSTDRKDKKEKDKKEDSSANSSATSSSFTGTGEDKSSIKREDGRYTVPVERWSMPENPVNEYGMTLRAMRCLEITESVCQLRGLMDFAASNGLAPKDALRKLAEEFRNSKSPNKSSSLGINLNSTTSPNGSSASGAGSTDTSNSGIKRKVEGGDSSAAKVEDTDGSNAGDGNGPNKRAK
ncbi:unnamed protein product [Sympodiomycopsis kandeliae]